LVEIDGEPIEFAPRLFKLLTVMGANLGNVLTYRNLSTQIWGPEHPGGDLAALRVAISALRAKLGSGPNRPVVLNAPHVGYRLALPDAMGEIRVSNAG
jgi:two-component system KDP operon response regulator KdpE